MWQEYDLIMLPTNHVSDLFIWYNKLEFSKSPQKVNCQYLCLLSDEEIKEGDWYTNGRNIFQCKDLKDIDKERYDYLKKIIVTTDTSLEIAKDIKSPYCKNNEIIGYQLPQFPQYFINHFITEYNKGNVIIKVKVEYIVTHETGYDKPLCIKLNSDNTVNIQLIKQSWTREEVLIFARKYEDFMWNMRQKNGSAFHDSLETEWITKNL